MVDCADRDRIDEARQELHRIINDREMRESLVLVFANKQDLPDGKGIYKRCCAVEAPFLSGSPCLSVSYVTLVSDIFKGIFK